LLSDFILLGSDQVGSYALSENKVDLWSLSVDSIAKSIAEVVNQHAIPRLLKLNAMRVDTMPELTFGQVTRVKLSEAADFVNKMVLAGVIVPDPILEEHMRALAELPPV